MNDAVLDLAGSKPLAPPAAEAARPPLNRKRVFTIFGASLAVIALGYGAYAFATGGSHVSTDNAYVNADVAQVTPLIAGSVAEVRVVDTQSVRKGDVLVVVDPADARIAVRQAEAELARASRRVQQTMATGQSLSSQVTTRGAEIAGSRARIATARSELEKARIDLQRREALRDGGAVSGEELTSARNAFAAAQAGLAAAEADLTASTSTRASAEGQFAANDALVKGTTLDTNPEILAARAQLDRAQLDLARTVIRAPFDGVVSRRQVQVGQRVAPGAQLMTIVPISQVYVEANFKEVQLARVRPGQPVELVADLYGDKVKYHGRVAGFSGGTGSAFAVIPAQNATGNWIKVVQRLPVRVTLDPRELAEHPLRIGLSMDAVVDTTER
ncbi:HlyD family efflux transporter periplasmic adaptor subunit [Phenylobacterium sp. LjRoot225]|uniref:HlyD family secretion protein n=1 Tax=Phenylobacterium sp. LjRoot225 TaxID=3342285 RepID=UPI003ECF46B9